MLKFLSFFIFIQINTFGQNITCEENLKDTLTMLLGVEKKYWDKIDNPPNYGKSRVINEGWCLQRKPLVLSKYKYSESNPKKRYEPIEVDILIGKLNILIKKDTIIIPEMDAKILIIRLTTDTLIVKDINGGFIGDGIFIKSKDQKQNVEPAIKYKRQ